MASTLTQATRGIAVSSPLGTDVLVFRSMTVRERLGSLFDMQLSVASENGDIDGKELLGKNMTVRLATLDGGERYFNGFVTRFQHTPQFGRLATYLLELRPWLWFLTRTSDCRIFQEKTVPDVIKEVFRENGLTEFEDRLSSSYRNWEFCVQYRETDFDFLSRLMEQEGIYYYFVHSNGKHTLVLADGIGSHDALPEDSEIPFVPDGNVEARGRHHIHQWSLTQQVQPGHYALQSFDFKRSKQDLLVVASDAQGHDLDAFEMYDYPGEYAKTGEGEHYVRTRLQESTAQFARFDGEGNVRTMQAGGLFTLIEHPRADFSKEYLVVGVTHQLASDDYEAGGGGGQQYSCSLEAMLSAVQFRSPSVTPKPLIPGPQTAFVVGKPGEEIWTDEHGRVKLKFHWDRYSQGDETSSCWVRVSSAWAGQQWGAISLPRIGQEVIVEFLEGDPDQPIVTGRVYNGQNQPPYTLPDNQTLSGVKSNSSKGGQGFNELRFEDKKGEEQIFLHGEKNLDVRIKNDRFEFIGHDRHLRVKNDKFEHVEHDRNEIVGADHKESIGKDRHVTVKGKQCEKVNETLSVTVQGDVAHEYKSNHSETVTQDLYLKATNIVIEASQNITIKVGQSFIAIEAGGIKLGTNGDIVLDAKMNIKQQAGINLEAKANAMGKVEANATLDLKGSAMVNVQGGLVKIN